MLAFKPHRAALFQLAFSPDGGSVASSGKSPMLCVSDAATGKPRWSFAPDRAAAFGLGVVYSPDGKFVATADWDTVSTFRADTGEVVCESPGRGYAVAFTPDSKGIVALAPRPGAYVHRTDLATGGTENFRGGDMFDHCNRFAFSPDGKLFAVHGDAEVSVADAKSAALRHYFPLSNAPCGVGALAFSPCGRFLAYSDGPKLFLHDRLDGVVGPRKRSAKHIQEAAFTPDGRHLITVSNDETAVVWEAAGLTEVRSFAWSIGKLKSVAVSADGTRAACGSDRGRVVVWDLDL